MGKARRLRKENRKKLDRPGGSIFKDKSGDKQKHGQENLSDIIESKIDQELKEVGLPTQFSSTKGEHIEGQIIAEAARRGMIRRYQQFQNIKLKNWQRKKVRGTKTKQRRNAQKVVML